jgi:hypothetical protein
MLLGRDGIYFPAIDHDKNISVFIADISSTPTTSHLLFNHTITK